MFVCVQYSPPYEYNYPPSFEFNWGTTRFEPQSWRVSLTRSAPDNGAVMRVHDRR